MSVGSEASSIENRLSKDTAQPSESEHDNIVDSPQDTELSDSDSIYSMDTSIEDSGENLGEDSMSKRHKPLCHYIQYSFRQSHLVVNLTESLI